jgi:hypothetical protein
MDITHQIAFMEKKLRAKIDEKKRFAKYVKRENLETLQYELEATRSVIKTLKSQKLTV